VKMSRS